MSDYSKKRILIVDDVVTVRTVIKKSLKELAIDQIDEADSMTSALDKLKAALADDHPYDLIMSDWNMPGGDGIELLQSIRSSKNREFSLTKFIMITGANDKVLKAMNEGANNVIHKPFPPETIHKKLDLIWGP